MFPPDLAAKARRVIQGYAAQRRTLCLAESCSGGLLAALLTQEAGASRVLVGSLVAYSRQIKVDDLAVPQALLDAEGSVSLRVTLAMAQAAQRRAAVGLALTGLAGPAGDLSDISSSPVADISVGRVYLVCLHQDKTYHKICDYTGTRQEIRLAAVADALDMLLVLA